MRIVRAFVALRQLAATHRTLSAKFAELEARVGTHDRQLAAVIASLRQLALPAAPAHGRKIGFHPATP